MRDSPTKPIVGIVGGIGAGKSSVLRHVRALRIHVIDADEIGHDLLEVADIREQIVHAYGQQVLNLEGRVDRRQLATLVFGTDEKRNLARTKLNDIIHPAIRTEIQRQIQAAPQEVEVIILDAALLLEAGWAEECDALIFIDTPLEQRQRRVAETRGWSVEEHQRREASQWNLDRKRQFTNFTVDNSSSLEKAAEQLEDCLKEIIQKTTC